MVYRLHICWAFRFFDESFMCFAILHTVLTPINAAPPSLTIPVKARILCISLNFIAFKPYLREKQLFKYTLVTGFI